jgi:hypothetical protein
MPNVDTRVGSRDEDISPPDLDVRGRVRLGLPIGLFAGVSYTPPLEWDHFRSSVVGGEIGWRVGFGPHLFAGVRGSLTYAESTGPIAQRGDDDTFRSLNRGVDGTLGVLLFDHVAPYAGVGYGHVDTTLRVESDGVKLEASNGYWYGLVGFEARLGGASLAFEQDFSESFLRHIWIGLSYRF